MFFKSRAHADWRALTAAALLGSGVGLALGAAYMAGGLARTASDHARASRLAQGAAGAFSESALQEAAARMDYGVLTVARRHDPFTFAGAAERDRQSAIFAARLERKVSDVRDTGTELVLRASLPAVVPAAPFRLSGPLDASRDVECLTQAVYYEARGETPAGQAAVAQVVLNRVRHPAFPKTVCGVVFQGAGQRGCQFSFACNGAMRRGRETGAWRRAERVAMRALSGETVSEVGSATHFHTTGVSPAWGPRLLKVTQVGMHVFYRFGRNAGLRSGPAAPEETAEPVYAAPAPAPRDLAPSDLRLTSLVLEPETAASAVAVATEVAATVPAKPAAEKAPVPAPAKATPTKAAPTKALAKPVGETARLTAPARPAAVPGKTAIAADS